MDDLVEFNRIKLGLGITVHPAPFDVADLFADELDELRAAHPDRRLELKVRRPPTDITDPCDHVVELANRIRRNTHGSQALTAACFSAMNCENGRAAKDRRRAVTGSRTVGGTGTPDHLRSAWW